MLVEQAIQNLLLADAGVAAIVATRVYSPVLPQTVDYPAIAYRLATTERLGVPLNPTEGRRTGRLICKTIRIFATAKGPSNLTQVKNLSEAIGLCLEGFAGTVVDVTLSPVATVEIQGIMALTTFDEYDDKTQTHQSISTFDVYAVE